MDRWAEGVATATSGARAVQQSPESRRSRVRQYIVDNMLLGVADGFADDTSLLDASILDSTGAMELVGFIEASFGIEIADHEIIPEYLDSVDRICAFLTTKLA